MTETTVFQDRLVMTTSISLHTYDANFNTASMSAYAEALSTSAFILPQISYLVKHFLLNIFVRLIF